MQCVLEGNIFNAFGKSQFRKILIIFWIYENEECGHLYGAAYGRVPLLLLLGLPGSSEIILASNNKYCLVGLCIYTDIVCPRFHYVLSY